MSAADVDPAWSASARITYVEGYLVGLPSAEGALAAAVKAAHAAGRQSGADAVRPALGGSSSATPSRRCCPDVDILLANEEEALELTGESDLEAGSWRSVQGRACPVVAVTRGAAGAIATDGKETVSVAAEPVDHVVDTTGAGDLFAAGFLFGLARELPLRDCCGSGRWPPPR